MDRSKFGSLAFFCLLFAVQAKGDLKKTTLEVYLPDGATRSYYEKYSESCRREMFDDLHLQFFGTKIDEACKYWTVIYTGAIPNLEGSFYVGYNYGVLRQCDDEVRPSLVLQPGIFPTREFSVTIGGKKYVKTELVTATDSELWTLLATDLVQDSGYDMLGNYDPDLRRAKVLRISYTSDENGRLPLYNQKTKHPTPFYLEIRKFAECIKRKLDSAKDGAE